MTTAIITSTRVKPRADSPGSATRAQTRAKSPGSTLRAPCKGALGAERALSGRDHDTPPEGADLTAPPLAGTPPLLDPQPAEIAPESARSCTAFVRVAGHPR